YPASPVASDLLARRVPLEVMALGSQPHCECIRTYAEELFEPAIRNHIERTICDAVEGLSIGDVIFAPRPPGMQAQEADMFMEWEGGNAQSLKNLALERGVGAEVLELDRQYGELWSVSLYLRPAKQVLVDQVRSVARRILSKDYISAIVRS